MKCRLFRNTADCMAIDRGDEILVDKKRYVVTGHERERRFGMEDPKFWVKTAIDKDTGERKILKLSFFESFETSLGGIKIRRFRNPEKEGDILQVVKDHPSFMHGDVFRDDHGNNVRVLDIVHGCPAVNLAIELWSVDGQGQKNLLKTVRTNVDGRTDIPLLVNTELKVGVYELVFAVGEYFVQRGQDLSDPAFLDRVPIQFGVADPSTHYHVPLLTSPWSYSTYRGS